ncbi:MAG: hypothetical protein JSV17_11855 [Candidatus Aminicenantes bacterium]|nr:MAG: hypothetical protein JSV17_11855 [Candidatus Aminicenantes bacterium]
MNKFSPHLWILALALFTLVGCSTLKLESTWKDRDITLDGKGGEWLGAKYYFEDSAISVGLINDEQYLYVSMMTENPMIRAQIMRQGLTIWLDPDGGKNKTFGIKFPLGKRGEEQEGERMDPPAMMDEMIREEIMQKLQESMTELEILGRDEKVLAKMDIEDTKGIEVKMRNVGGTFVYELKVPLVSREEYPFTIGANPGDTIGVGFLSPKMQMKRPNKMRGMGGMPPGGSGGMPPGGGMRGYGMKPMMPQDLKIWAKVQLASGSTPTLTFF